MMVLPKQSYQMKHGNHQQEASDSSNIYNGETIDARLEKTGWTLPGYNDAKWSGVKVENFSNDNLIATNNEPVKKHETFKPVKIITTPKGEKVIDFGQNLVGWVMLKVNGMKAIRLNHMQKCWTKKVIFIRKIFVRQKHRYYILKGEGEEIFEPHFTTMVSVI